MLHIKDILVVFLLRHLIEQHIRREILFELDIAVLVMPDCPLSQISLPTVFQMQIASFLQRDPVLRAHRQLFLHQAHLISIKKPDPSFEEIFKTMGLTLFQVLRLISDILITFFFLIFSSISG